MPRRRRPPRAGRIERAAIRLATWPPIRVIGEYGPERLLLNFGCVLIGLGALVEPHSGVLADWPTWFVYEWSAAMFAGGLFALWGIVAGGWARTPAAKDRARLVEWAGYVCLGLAALCFGVGSLLSAGVEALRVSVLFLAIAAAKGVRLLLAYAARAQYLQTAARAAVLAETGEADPGGRRP